MDFHSHHSARHSAFVLKLSKSVITATVNLEASNS